MKKVLNTEEKTHSRNAELIEILLNTDFHNENYNIFFEFKSPNTVKGVFTKKDNNEIYESNFGLPVEGGGKIIRAETHIIMTPIVIWGIKNGERLPYHPDFEISSTEFIDFLNYSLIFIHDNRGVKELNNPSPTGGKNIDDLPFD